MPCLGRLLGRLAVEILLLLFRVLLRLLNEAVTVLGRGVEGVKEQRLVAALLMRLCRALAGP